MTCFIGLLAVSSGLGWWLLHGAAASAPMRPTINAESLRSGDIIFRRGPSVESRAVMTLDRDSDFSHVGIVLRRNDAIFVIHVVPGEGEPEVTKIEPIEDYLRSDRAIAASAYRVVTDTPSSIETAVRTANQYVERNVPFDNKFDLASDEALYCTELVWRAYKKAGLDLVDGHFDSSSTSFIRGPILWPSSLLHSPHLVQAWNWKQQKEE